MEVKEDPEILCKNITILQNLLSQRIEQLDLTRNENERLRTELQQTQHVVKSLQSNESSKVIQLLERQLSQFCEANKTLKIKMKKVRNALQEIINDSSLPSPLRQKLVLLLPLLFTTDSREINTPLSSSSASDSCHNDDISIMLSRTHSSSPSTCTMPTTITTSDGTDSVASTDIEINTEEDDEGAKDDDDDEKQSHAKHDNNIFIPLSTSNLTPTPSPLLKYKKPTDEKLDKSSSRGRGKNASTSRLSVKPDKQLARVDSLKKKRYTAPSKILQHSTHMHSNTLEINFTDSGVTLQSKALPGSSGSSKTTSFGHQRFSSINTLESLPLRLKSADSTPVSPLWTSSRRKPKPPERKPPPPTRRGGHYKTLTTLVTPSSPTDMDIINDSMQPTSRMKTKSKVKENIQTSPSTDFVLEFNASKNDTLENQNKITPYIPELAPLTFSDPITQSLILRNTDTIKPCPTKPLPSNMSSTKNTGRMVKRSGSAGTVVSPKEIGKKLTYSPNDVTSDCNHNNNDNDGYDNDDDNDNDKNSNDNDNSNDNNNENSSDDNSKIRSVSANENMLQKIKIETSSDQNSNNSRCINKNTRVWTLADLVMDVTSSASNEMQKTLSALILCHKAFTDSISLLQQLRCQFREGDRLLQLQLKGVNEEEKKSDNWSVRVRVCNVVRFWIKHYWEEDFVSQPELQKEVWYLKQDIDKICESQKAQTLKEKLDMTIQSANNGKVPSVISCGIVLEKNENENEAINKLIDNSQTKKIKGDVDNTNTTIKTGNEEDNEENYRQDQVHLRWPYIEINDVIIPPGMDLMLLDPDDVAQQLTLMDFHLFKQIKARECIGQSWKKKGKEKWRLAANILRMIAQFNSVSKWVQLTVLGGPTARERANLIKKLVTMMKSLQKNRNFSSFCACHAALNSDYIQKLKQSWEKLPRPSRKEWDEMNEIFDWRMTKLKQLQEQSIAPAVPHIGLYLQVLFNIDEGKKDTTTETGVNYVKMMMLNEQIEKLMLYQQGKYEVTEMSQIQKLLYQEFATQFKMSDKHISQLADIVRYTER